MFPFVPFKPRWISPLGETHAGGDLLRRGLLSHLPSLPTRRAILDMSTASTGYFSLREFQLGSHVNMALLQRLTSGIFGLGYLFLSIQSGGAAYMQ